MGLVPRTKFHSQNGLSSETAIYLVARRRGCGFVSRGALSASQVFARRIHSLLLVLPMLVSGLRRREELLTVVEAVVRGPYLAREKRYVSKARRPQP